MNRVFHTQIEARQFFEDKIVEPAHVDGIPLSPDERLMLKWSEIEPESIADSVLAERLAAEISDEDYEAKIAGLLSRSYVADVTKDSGAKKTCADAYSTLSQGDHYILIMVGRALRDSSRTWWKFRW